MFPWILQSLQFSLDMFWEVLWPLILGIGLSAVIQAVVSAKSLTKLLGDSSLKSLTLAAIFGAASSSCSYAAVALAKTLVKKGANFTSAMVFEIASTNLVIELGIILLVLMGWQFMLAEILGGILMIALIVMIFKATLSKDLLGQAHHQLQKGLIGRMEGHAGMEGMDISHYFVMDWASIWTDLLLGFLIAGVLATSIPDTFWGTLFFKENPNLNLIIGPLMGPVIAIISFVCSVGNIPLAAVLWKEGISFGGVISFIYADLIVLPILNIYRKYYGFKMMLYLLGVFYAVMVMAGFLVEGIFSTLSLIPQNHHITLFDKGIIFNYTFVLNILFSIVAIILIVRFFQTGGIKMLKMMDVSQDRKVHHA